MATYCQIDDAYNSKNNGRNEYNRDIGIIDDVDLDKMARQVNDQKKKNSRDIYKNYRSGQNSLSRGITAYNNLNKKSYDKGTEIPNVTTGFFSAQGDYSNVEHSNVDHSNVDHSNETTLYKSDSNGMLISDILKKKEQENLDSKSESSKSESKIRVKKKKRKSKKYMLEDMMKYTNYNKNNHDHLELSSVSDGSLLSDSLDSLDSLDSFYLSDLSESSEDTLISNAYNNKFNNTNKLYGMSEINKTKFQNKFNKNTFDKIKKKDSITLDDIYQELKINSKYDSNSKNKCKNNNRKCIDYDLQSVDSLESLESGESLLEHINQCDRCKDHVVDLIRKNRNTNTNSNNDNKNNTLTESNNLTQKNNSQYMEIKEILTVCLIGFIVIIILDMAINYKGG
jgi:hypothetical protein